MAKRSNYERDSERVEVEDELLEEEEFYASIEEEETEDEPSETVRLTMVRDLTLNIRGPVTGQMYRFSGSGSYLYVDKDDAEIMITKRGSKACCGGSSSPIYFQIDE